MASYRISLRIDYQIGTRHPETKVSWGCTRLPNARVDGGLVDVYAGERVRPEDRGEMYGVYHAIKDAEARGETLARDDIEVEQEIFTHTLKGGKIEKSAKAAPITRSVSQEIYNEVNARKRPLGSDA